MSGRTAATVSKIGQMKIPRFPSALSENVVQPYQRHYLEWLLKYFPSHSTSYVFGYGPCLLSQGEGEAGVDEAFTQAARGTSRTKERVDLIFVVDDPLGWHQRNLVMNPRHYSFLKYFGAKAITKVQKSWAAGAYFNPFVTVKDKLVKYGVISTAALNNDLRHWSHMFIAGRLHKPVLELQAPSTETMYENLRLNHLAALRMTLLQLPPESTKYELYYGITSLSYIGDFRLYIEEDPKQIRDMILPLMDKYDRIYMPLLKSLKPIVKLDKRRHLICQDDCRETRLSHLLSLPLAVQLHLAQRFKFPLARDDLEEAMISISQHRHVDLYALKSLRSIVTRSVLKQTIQGFFTAGLFKSIWYGVDKIDKKVSRVPNKLPIRSSSLERHPIDAAGVNNGAQQGPTPTVTKLPLGAAGFYEEVEVGVQSSKKSPTDKQNPTN